jgi:archaellum component FlaC
LIQRDIGVKKYSIILGRSFKGGGEEGHPKKGGLIMSTTEMKSPEEKTEKKKAYQEKVEGQLKEWGAKIEELRAKAETSRTELKIKYEKQIEDLRAKQEAVQQKLREFKESGEETWEEIKTSLEKGLNDLKDSFDRTVSKIKKKGEEAVERASKKRKAYVKKMEIQLKDWSAEIDLLRAKAEKSKAEAKLTYLKQIKELKSKQASLKRKLRELKGSGDEAWVDFKEGMEVALNDMKRALKQAASRFKKK